MKLTDNVKTPLGFGKIVDFDLPADKRTKRVGVKMRTGETLYFWPGELSRPERKEEKSESGSS